MKAGYGYGIGIAVVGDKSYPIAVYRSLDDATWAAIATLPAGTETYFDSLPADGVERYYRARHEAEGYTPGPYSGSVSATPVAVVP